MRCWDIPAAAYGMLICAILGWSSDASGHSWYPRECCSDRDCAPYASENVKHVAHGFRLHTGEFIHQNQARISPDGAYHLCRSEYTHQILCFFYPPPGS
jgi:hypothetical protein